jgi:Zn-dependent oligopeptidase
LWCRCRDLPYYTGLVKSRRHQLDGKALSQFLPLDGVLRGVALLVKSLFNISMERVPMDRSEAWTPGVDDVYKVCHATPPPLLTPPDWPGLAPSLPLSSG